MKGRVFLFQEVQPCPKILHLFRSRHTRHEVMATTHHKTGKHLGGVPVVSGVYIEPPCNALVLLIVLYIRPKGSEAIRPAVMLQYYILTGFGGVIVDVAWIFYG